MNVPLFAAWRQAFMSVIQNRTFAKPLKGAALKGQRCAWTQATTAASIAACQTLGWEATAQGSCEKITINIFAENVNKTIAY